MGLRCCDPWDSKVLRSGCGAQFYMPVITNYRLSSLLDNIQYDSGCSDTGEDAVWDGNATENSSAREVVSESSPTITEKSSPSFALLLADSNDSQIDAREPLPIFSYTDADYRTFKKIYLVVGGETEGLSHDILQIAANVKTSIHSRILQPTVARLRIPLLHNMDSLNSSNAFSIIVYEMLRQFQSGKTGVS
ncbi:unnamed protein product [Allacma fusca]|uniref:tRNA/rRNA methyltransferase SpoU type domain-containing protein n=1 Tax=Allacma fusca TaxID=39272 RepID=A0A8J2JVH1_9HEXA|nr:unnamed protein product [Allacma fusca]